MAKGNIIRLNFLHLNSVPLNGSKEVQRGSASGGGSIVPIPPSIPTFILTAGVANGVVTATLDGKAISLPYKAYKGDEIVLSVTPNDGYEFEGWSDGNKSNPRTIVVNEDITLNASCKEVFVPLPTYTLSASVSNGVVSATLNGSAISLPYEANEGDVIVVSVAPNDGYTFEGWLDGNTDNPRTITMASDVVLSAECIAVPSESKYIVFEDAEVERVLMSKGVSSDGVGITKEDAERVTSIGTWFKGNTTIQSFEEFAYFKNCTSLVASAFDGCTSLNALSFPSSITSIGGYACRNVPAPMVLNLPNLTTISTAAFNGSGLVEIKDLGKVSVIGATGAVVQAASGVFANCKALTKVHIPSSVTYIGGMSFVGCTALASVSGCEGVTNIVRQQAFDGCSALVGVLTLPSIKVVDQYSFRNCKFERVELGADCTTIAAYAFQNNTAMTAFICRATTPPSLGNTNALANTNNCPIYVPDASLEAYKGATNWSSYTSRIKGISEYNG